MGKYFSNFDWGLVFALLAILALGLFVLASVSPELLFQQLAYVFLGIILFFVLAQIDYHLFEAFPGLIFAGSLVFLSLPFFFGAVTRGAVRWLSFGGINIQPSEIIKPLLILFFAWFFGSFRINLGRFLAGILFLIVPVGLVFFQPDLGSSLVVAFFWLGIVFGAGINSRYLLSSAIFSLVSIPLIWRILKDYQRQRILAFLSPEGDPLGAGYHLVQSTVAVGSGQWWGRGFGRGTQSHFRFLPEKQTDFIFASLSEEMGFLGGVILLAVYLFLLLRILKIAEKTNDPFGYLICLGVFSMIFFQLLVNVGMNLGLLPVAGITLPLVSYGGSSLVATLISLGLVENVSRLSREHPVCFSD